MYMHASLLVVVHDFLWLLPETENKGYLMLFRKHVSEQATGKGRELLEELELEQERIAAIYGNIDRKESEAVQKGLEKWRNGRANPPTWAVLLNAMDKAGIATTHIEGLKEELMKYAACK